MTARDQHGTGRRTTARPQIRTPQDRERFRAQLLARLPGPEEDAVSSNELGAHFQLDAYQRSNLLWSSLDHMTRLGWVERIAQPNERVMYWRRTAAGDQHIEHPTGTP